MKKQMIATIVLLLSINAFAKQNKKEIRILVTEKGFEPKSVDVKAGAHVVLKVTRKTDTTCAKQIQVPSIKIPKTDLPRDQVVSIDLGILEKGKVRFGCGMDMMESAEVNVN
ncbi:cupredoxin domain-containing protein [bacterium]|nr:cupredoxin domain-containing protein [bacterium]